MDQQSFVSGARAKLRERSADLVELRARLELSDGPPRVDAQTTIDAFLSHQKLAEATLDRIAKIGPKAWEDRAPVFEMTWQALEQRLDETLGAVD